MTTMQRVAGLDLSLAHAGIAVITKRVDGNCLATTATFTSRAPRGEERIADLAACVDRAVCAARLAVIAPADGSPADPLRCAVLAALTGRGVQVVTVPPTEHTIDVAELWPTVNLANAGEVAALQLAHYAAARQGWVLPRGVTPSGLGERSVAEVDFALYGSRGTRVTDRDPRVEPMSERQPRQPRRDPAKSVPRIAEEDRPDTAELERQRQLTTRRRVQPRVWR